VSATTDHRFSRSFRLITCQGCGASRIRGVSCADCGASPRSWEVDPELQRRQAMVQQLTLVLAAPDTPQPSATVFDFAQDRIFERIASWLGDFLRSLAESAESKYRNTGPLRDAIGDFLELQSFIRASPPSDHSYGHTLPPLRWST
jgi:ribosomal protein L32